MPLKFDYNNLGLAKIAVFGQPPSADIAFKIHADKLPID